MAGLPRPAPARKPSTRPPATRPPPIKTQSTTQSLRRHSKSTLISPTESVVSNSKSTNASRSSSKSRSPPLRQTGVRKRKERESEQDGGQETNIHVVVRCRGRNEREVKENSGVVVSTDDVKGNCVELSMGPSTLSKKTYNFDKVFSHAADQSMIYEDVVSPILNEVRALYILQS